MKKDEQYKEKVRQWTSKWEKKQTAKARRKAESNPTTEFNDVKDKILRRALSETDFEHADNCGFKDWHGMIVDMYCLTTEPNMHHILFNHYFSNGDYFLHMFTGSWTVKYQTSDKMERIWYDNPERIHPVGMCGDRIDFKFLTQPDSMEYDQLYSYLSNYA